jgi:hypothetical protein
MPTALNSFFSCPSPGAVHAAGPSVAGQRVSGSSLKDCSTSKVVSQVVQRYS